MLNRLIKYVSKLFSKYCTFSISFGKKRKKHQLVSFSDHVLKSNKQKAFSNSYGGLTQGRTSCCECFGNQPLHFDEVTKCDEKQLNTSVPTETSCPPVISLCFCWWSRERFLLDMQLPFVAPQFLQGLVPGFNCFSHSRVEHPGHILKEVLLHTEDWEVITLWQRQKSFNPFYLFIYSNFSFHGVYQIF